MAGNKLKLVVFDLNETLITENTWKELNLAMGVTEAEDKQFMDWYEEGVITYEEGQKLLEKIYKIRGNATKQNILAAMKYTYKPGTKEIVDYLNKNGIRIVLLSGSIDVLVSRVADELGIIDWAAHNKIEFDETGKFKRIVCRGDDADFKVEMMVKFANQYGVLMSETLCVGDEINDRKLFEMCGHGVAFKNSRAEKYAWKVIEDLHQFKEVVENF